MSNRLTLIIDGGWLLMSRFGVLEERFRIDRINDIEKEKSNLIDLLYRSVWGMLYKFPEIDNIIITTEGGSWRKYIEKPDQLKDVEYKGNREPDTTYDWGAIYKAYDVFIEGCDKIGINVPEVRGAEGDDLIWYWSKTLNEKGVNTIIWTADGDLKQLVKMKEGVFTCWFNDKQGIFIPENLDKQEDLIDLLLYPPTYSMDIFEQVRSHCFKTTEMNPDRVVMEKILSGDSSDNVKSCVSIEKGPHHYGIGPATCKKLLNVLGEPKTMEKFLELFDDIPYCITENFPMFKNCDTEIIKERLEYNKTLVWLNESTIPENILNEMSKYEYRKVNCRDLKEKGYPKQEYNEIDLNVDELFE